MRMKAVAVSVPAKGLGDVNNLKICVITQPLPKIKGGHILVSNFLEILEPLSNEIFVITGNFPEDLILDRKIHIENVKSDSKRETMWIRTFKYILTQSKLSFNLIKISKNVDIVIFFIGGVALLLPMLSAKLLRKRVVLIATGSASITAKKIYNERFFGMGGFIFSHIIAVLEKINYNISDRIVVLSDSLIHDLRLSRYRYKIDFNCATFIDIERFRIETDVQQRKNLIGYIGRMSEEKGIRNFIRAVPLLPPKYDTQFLIGGDGILLNEAKDELKSNGFYDRVVFSGWIPHEELPGYLNDLKLLVMPSYTEVFAAAALEAMACGTPVLAAPVGSTTDIIKDGENGFIMENNSPKCIAKNIERALEHPNLDKIAKNARDLVEKKFSYQTVMEGYREILREGHD